MDELREQWKSILPADLAEDMMGPSGHTTKQGMIPFTFINYLLKSDKTEIVVNLAKTQPENIRSPNGYMYLRITAPTGADYEIQFNRHSQVYKDIIKHVVDGDKELRIKRDGHSNGVINYVVEKATGSSKGQNNVVASAGENNQVKTDEIPVRSLTQQARADKAKAVAAKADYENAKAAYAELVEKGNTQSGHLYVNSVLITGQEDSVRLTQTLNSKQGSFIVFADKDGDKGYAFPNPAIDYSKEVFGRIFPDLTKEKFNAPKSIEPIRVVKIRTQGEEWEAIVQT